MMSYRTGAAAAINGSRSYATYVMEGTLSFDTADLARYYQCAMKPVISSDPAITGMANLVARKLLSFDEAMDALINAKVNQERLNAEALALPERQRPAATMGLLVGRNLMSFDEASASFQDNDVESALIVEWAEKATGEDQRSSVVAELRRAVSIAATLLTDSPAIGEPRRDMDPRLADLLGIDPNRPVTHEELAHLLNGKRADGEVIPGKAANLSPNGISIGFIDCVFSADKSVSLAWAFAPTEAERNVIACCHREAVDAALAHLEGVIGHARRGAGGLGGRDAGAIAWCKFDHYASRPTLELAQTDIQTGEQYTNITSLPVAGDPQLHTHSTIMNVVLTESGHVGSLDMNALKGQVASVGTYYQSVLATRLRLAGIDTVFDENINAARVVSIPDHVRVFFSKRQQEAQRAARDFAMSIGADWDSMSPSNKAVFMSRAVEQTRRHKNDDLGDFASWQRQAVALGWEHHSVIGAPIPLESWEVRREDAYQLSLSLLDKDWQREAVLTGVEMTIAAGRGLISTGTTGFGETLEITRMMRERGVRQDGRDTHLIVARFLERGRERFFVTTAAHEAREIDVVRMARTAQVDRTGALAPWQIAEAVARHPELDFTSTDHRRAQRDAMERIGTGGRLGVFVGGAGAGKTTMLIPLVDVWKAQRRPVYGISLAWLQADGLADTGIDAKNVFAIAPFLDAVNDGRLALTPNAVVVVDELGLVGTRQLQTLLSLQERHGFRLVMLGDDRQCGSIEAGPVIDLMRHALGPDAIPEILTTIRQRTEREQEIAGLFREGDAEAALAMKREDGTAILVAGDYHDAVERIVALRHERIDANADDPNFRISISAPTNDDARSIGRVLRAHRQQRGEIGPNVVRIEAQDRAGARYKMDLAVGDRVRLFSNTVATFSTGRRGTIGRNASVLTVEAVDEQGLVLRNRKGVAGRVAWSTLCNRETGVIQLSYGDVLTIDSSQGSTVTEHIHAMPGGTRTVSGPKAYVAESRHTERAWLVTSDGAERREVSDRRALGDPRPLTTEDVWANMARNLSRRPERLSALAFLEAATNVRRMAGQALSGGLQPGEQAVQQGQAVSGLGLRFAVRRGVAQVVAMAERVERVAVQLAGLQRAAREIGQELNGSPEM